MPTCLNIPGNQSRKSTMPHDILVNIITKNTNTMLTKPDVSSNVLQSMPFHNEAKRGSFVFVHH